MRLLGCEQEFLLITHGINALSILASPNQQCSWPFCLAATTNYSLSTNEPNLENLWRQYGVPRIGYQCQSLEVK